MGKKRNYATRTTREAVFAHIRTYVHTICTYMHVYVCVCMYVLGTYPICWWWKLPARRLRLMAGQLQTKHYVITPCPSLPRASCWCCTPSWNYAFYPFPLPLLPSFPLPGVLTTAHAHRLIHTCVKVMRSNKGTELARPFTATASSQRSAKKKKKNVHLFVDAKLGGAG